jgi:predicted ATP-grasp superfamily ATP-dependent carboligase
MKVLVTDADYPNALAAIRSIGKKNVHVVAGASLPLAQSFFSKYCGEKVIYPKADNETAFVRFIASYLETGKTDVVLPIGYDATTALSKHLNEFPSGKAIPVADWKSMEIACDKGKTIEFAKKLDLSVPRTYKSLDEIDKFPVVAKGTKGSGRIMYLNSPGEVMQTHASDSVFQEYIPGQGYGFFALFNEGEERAVFMHKRIREYPVTGGQSTCAESVHDARLMEQGLRLLRALKWHGVAMVEFKKDSRDGDFKLMEINPKFWGSLDLSIASGVDFPYLTIKMAVEGDVKPAFEYRTGIRFRWVFPYDVMHVLANPASTIDFVREFFDKRTMTNIWLNDFGPNLIQILSTVVVFNRQLLRGDIRYPQGFPRTK